ncbi:MAG: hypothetical protein AB198_01535 [Parcubacteria bacterium C7867-003]|nr:MAG: hypothetical protein AB198_01535 [Parcubacteria bacterium C7867-003]
MSNLKKLIFVLAFFLVLVVASFYSNLSKGNVFQGTLKSTKEGSVVVYGAYETEILKKKDLYEMEIKVPGDTKITKTAFFIISGDDRVDMSKVPKEVSTVDFLTLKADSENVPVGIKIVLSDDFWSKIIPKSSEIEYIAPKY